MTDKDTSAAEPRLLDQVRARIRLKHYSIRTETAYVDWIRRFILFHGKRHPREMGKLEAEAFLSHLAVAKQVSASTQNQAKSALLFLYKETIGDRPQFSSRLVLWLARPLGGAVVVMRGRSSKPLGGEAQPCNPTYLADF